MTAAVWGAGFRSVLAKTLPEQKQKHKFLQRPRAIWRAPVGTVEQLLFWIRIEAEQQRERDLTRRSAARRIFDHARRGSRSCPFATLIGASERARKVRQNAPISVSNGHDLTLLPSSPTFEQKVCSPESAQVGKHNTQCRVTNNGQNQRYS